MNLTRGDVLSYLYQKQLVGFVDCSYILLCYILSDMIYPRVAVPLS
jgi:hypothetical protein